MTSIEFALGFIAGEASFGLNASKDSSNGKWYCRPYLKVGLDSKDEAVLYSLQAAFNGVGRVREKRGGDVIAWEVESSDDLSEFISIVEKEDKLVSWEVSEKSETYNTWKKIVKIYVSKTQTDDQDRVDMVNIAKEEKLNVGAGRQDKDYQEILDWYAENRNTYPEVGRME